MNFTVVLWMMALPEIVYFCSKLTEPMRATAKLILYVFLLFEFLPLSGQAKENARHRSVNDLMKKAVQLQYTDWTEAKSAIDRAEQILQKTEDKHLQAAFHLEAAKIYYSRDLFDISLSYALRADREYENLEQSKALEAQNLVAIIYARMKNTPDALKTFKNYYDRVKNKDVNLTVRALNNIGTIYLNSPHLDSAFYYYDKADRLLSRSTNPDLKVMVNTNLARAYVKKKDTASASSKLQEAERQLLHVSNNSVRIFVYLEMATFYLNAGNPQKAIYYAKKAEDISAVRYSFQNKDVLKLLYEAHLKAGDFKQAAQYFADYDKVRDSLNIEEKAVNIEKEKIRADYANKRKEDELLNSRRKWRMTVIILVLLSVTLISLFFLLRYRSSLEKKKLESALYQSKERQLALTLELRNKELMSKSMIDNERSGFYQEIASELKRIRSSGEPDEMQKELGSIIFKLEKGINTGVWEEFNLRFNNVHDSFYKELHRLHPNLNGNDKKLCALIKLNLSSKEIATITNTSVKSIENSRTRLRKKLGLTHNKIELSEYLNGVVG